MLTECDAGYEICCKILNLSLPAKCILMNTFYRYCQDDWVIVVLTWLQKSGVDKTKKNQDTSTECDTGNKICHHILNLSSPTKCIELKTFNIFCQDDWVIAVDFSPDVVTEKWRQRNGENQDTLTECNTGDKICHHILN